MWPLKRGSIHMKFSMTGHGKKRRPFNTGDCLFKVTAWASLTVKRYTYSPCDEHQSSGPKPAKLCSDQ